MSVLQRVERWAHENGLRLRLEDPADEAIIDLTGELVAVRWRDAPLAFAIPPGLRAFWRATAGARVEHEEDDHYPAFVVHDFWVFSPDELVDLTHRWARIPADATKGSRRITADHLVAFAAAGQGLSDGIWCFDAARPTAGGEYRIVLGVDDAVRYVDDGEACVALGTSARDYDTFDDWLDAYAGGVCSRRLDELHGF